MVTVVLLFLKLSQAGGQRGWAQAGLRCTVQVLTSPGRLDGAPNKGPWGQAGDLPQSPGPMTTRAAAALPALRNPRQGPAVFLRCPSFLGQPTPSSAALGAPCDLSWPRRCVGVAMSGAEPQLWSLGDSALHTAKQAAPRALWLQRAGLGTGPDPVSLLWPGGVTWETGPQGADGRH